MKKMLLTVGKNETIADRIYHMDLTGDFMGEEFVPGQFVHIKCGEGFDPLLRRPMSVCDINDTKNKMTILYRREGKGTAILSEYTEGKKIDLLAPLGNGFPTDNVKPAQLALLVGGGIGVPPLYYLGRKLKSIGVKIKSILGFNSAQDVFWQNQFATLGETLVTTVDGSYKDTIGRKGLVTDFINKIEIGSSGWDVLYACGPNAMLRAIQNIVPKDKEAYISMEERMGCGVGACLACVCDAADDFVSVTNSKKYRRVCTEGPVFHLHEIKL